MILFLLPSCFSRVVRPDNTGVGTGTVDNIFRTGPLDFEVLSVQAVSSYAQIAPLEGDRFIDIHIALTNTTDSNLVLRDTDFQLQWGSGELGGFSDPMVALDNTMAPLEITLEAGKRIEYHYVFSTPKAVNKFSLCYLREREEVSSSAYAENPTAIFYVEFTV